MGDRIQVDFNVPAAMRDGVILRANVFRPEADGQYPVALARTPYDKDSSVVTPLLDAIRLARAGYIVAIQDVRGRGASEGEWSPFEHERQDGCDSVIWASQLPGSNGNVGMFGASYVGFTQWAAAIDAPPPLKAIVPSVTWSDASDGFNWRGGAFELGVMGFWLTLTGLDTLKRRHRDNPSAETAAQIRALVEVMDHLPDRYYASFLNDDMALLRSFGISTALSEALAAEQKPSFMSPLAEPGAYQKITVAAYQIGGWYDIFLNGTLHNFQALYEADPRRSRLIVGPWSHSGFEQAVGEQSFGYASQISAIDLKTDMTDLTRRWFDYWLKGIDNGIMSEAPVKLFVMGDNVWREESAWSLERTRYKPLYLHSQGLLSWQTPDDEPPDQYTYDPSDPPPTRGGALVMNPIYGIGVKDQRPTETRSDVLVYTSDILTEDVEVVGAVVVKLWACSDAPDTDFVARLIDIHPDGFAQNLTDGIVRARYRNGYAAEPLEAGQAYAFTIDLWATANVFKAGHRIRLQVASACFPRWDRNPNTGERFGAETYLRVARQTILHDRNHPSHILLPVIPR